MLTHVHRYEHSHAYTHTHAHTHVQGAIYADAESQRQTCTQAHTLACLTRPIQPQKHMHTDPYTHNTHTTHTHTGRPIITWRCVPCSQASQGFVNAVLGL